TPPVGQRTHEAVKATLAVAAPAAHRTGVGLGLAADGNDFLSRFWPHAHGLRSQVTEVRDRCSRTQALSVNPPSTYGYSGPLRGVASPPTLPNCRFSAPRPCPGPPPPRPRRPPARRHWTPRRRGSRSRTRGPGRSSAATGRPAAPGRGRPRPP